MSQARLSLFEELPPSYDSIDDESENLTEYIIQPEASQIPSIPPPPFAEPTFSSVYNQPSSSHHVQSTSHHIQAPPDPLPPPPAFSQPTFSSAYNNPRARTPSQQPQYQQPQFYGAYNGEQIILPSHQVAHMDAKHQEEQFKQGIYHLPFSSTHHQLFNAAPSSSSSSDIQSYPPGGPVPAASEPFPPPPSCSDPQFIKAYNQPPQVQPQSLPQEGSTSSPASFSQPQFSSAYNNPRISPSAPEAARGRTPSPQPQEEFKQGIYRLPFSSPVHDMLNDVAPQRQSQSQSQSQQQPQSQARPQPTPTRVSNPRIKQEKSISNIPQSVSSSQQSDPYRYMNEDGDLNSYQTSATSQSYHADPMEYESIVLQQHGVCSCCDGMNAAQSDGCQDDDCLKCMGVVLCIGCVVLCALSGRGGDGGYHHRHYIPPVSLSHRSNPNHRCKHGQMCTNHKHSH